MANVGNPNVVLEMSELQAAARALGLQVATFEIRRAEDIVLAFEALKDRADALYVVTDPLVITNRIRINTLALTARLPRMWAQQEFVQSGSLMSYGANNPDQFRRVADLVDKILRGAKPGDLPVEQPTKFDLVINLTTAKPHSASWIISTRPGEPTLPRQPASLPHLRKASEWAMMPPHERAK